MKKREKCFIGIATAIMGVAFGLVAVSFSPAKILAKAVNANNVSFFTSDSNALASLLGIEVDTTKNVGEINGVFSGDFETEFQFSNAGFGSTEFAFYDKDDVTTKVFSVVYTIKDSNVGSAFVIDYRDNTFHAFNESGDVSSVNQWTVDHFNVTSEIEAYPNTFKADVVGKLGVYYLENQVSVKVAQGWNGEIKDEVELAELTINGLSDGYIVKLESNSVYSGLGRSVGYDSVVVRSINGLNITNGELTDYTLTGTIQYEGEYVKNSKNVIEIMQAQELSGFKFSGKYEIDFSASGLGMFVSNSNAEILFDIDEKFKDKELGTYNLTVEFGGLQKEYLIKIKEGDSAPTKDIFSLNEDVRYYEDEYNKGYAVNTKKSDIQIGEYLHGDLELEYAYSKNGYGSTEFTVYDVDDPESKVFSVLRTFNYDNKGTAFVVDYRRNKVIALDVESDMSAVNAWYPWSVANSDDKKEIYPNNAGIYSKAGKIGLAFNGDSVAIKVSQGWDGEITNYLTLATLTVPNLSDGYILKLTGSTIIREKGDDSIVITSINGCNMSRESLPCQVINTFIRHPNEYMKGDKTYIDIPLGGNVVPFDFVNKVDISGVIVSTVKETFSSLKVVSNKVGEYALNISHNGIIKNYVANIVPAYETKTVFTSDSNASFVSAGGNKGISVKPYKQEATFEGVFNGDLEIEFAYEYSSYGTVRFDFYDKDETDKLVFSIYRSFGIGRPEKIEQGLVETTWGTAFVGYNGKYYALEEEFASATDAVLYCQDRNISYYPVNNAKASDPHCFYTDKWNIPGKLILTWNGNSVTIEATVGEGANITGKNTIAVLDLPNLKDGYNVKLTGRGYDEYHECEEGIMILGVNGTKFNNEYTSSAFFSKDMVYNGFKSGEDGIYVAKNGDFGTFACANNYEYYTLRWQKAIIEDEDFIKAGFNVEYDFDTTTAGTNQVTVIPVLYGFYGEAKTYSVYVEESAKIELDENGGDVLNSLYYSEHTFGIELPIAVKENWKFGGWYKGNVLFEGFNEFTSLADIVLTAHWYDDTCPEIQFVKNDFSVIRITEETDSLNISAQDVTAYDRATDKTFAKEEISVSVKAPDSEEYVSFDEFVFNNKLYGVYEIRYSATDNWTDMGDTVNNNNNYSSNNIGELIRVINYSAAHPTITLMSDVATTVYVGMKIQVPLATAKIADDALEYEVTLTVQDKDGNISLIDIKDGLYYDREGIYHLVYYATDDCGQSAMEKYEIVCKRDENKPQIQVAFDLSEIQVGQTLSVPKATAIDEEFGTLEVLVEVLYQNQIIATGDTVINDEGLYTVRYSAKDGANNIEIKEFDVIAVKLSDENTDKKSGCSGNVSVGFVLLLLVPVAFILKKESIIGDKNNEEKN